MDLKGKKELFWWFYFFKIEFKCSFQEEIENEGG